MRRKGGRYLADVIYNSTLECRSPALAGNQYFDYQLSLHLILHQTISEHREKGIPFDDITEWLNKEGYLTVRGKQFRVVHVHSILKERLPK